MNISNNSNFLPSNPVEINLKSNKRKLDGEEFEKNKKVRSDAKTSLWVNMHFDDLLVKKNIDTIHKRIDEKKNNESYLNFYRDIKKIFPECELSITPLDSFTILANAVFQLIEERLRESNYLLTDEIENIHNLLFNSIIKDVSFNHLSVTDPINPSIPAIFDRLYTCMQNMKDYITCETALEATEQLLAKKPEKSYQIIELEALAKEKDPNYIFKDSQLLIDQSKHQIKSWEDQLKKTPLILTRNFLQSNNLQDTYVLNSKEGHPLWIFKPDYQDLALNEKNGETAVFEHTASMVSKEFPVPKTIYIQLKNWVGSAQIFLEGAKKLNEINPQLVPQIELQKIIIFDLLFANTDRHSNNILFNQENQPYAIDHDLCFLRELRPELRLEYMECLHLDSVFFPEMLSLLSNKSLEKYKEAMLIHEEIPPEATDWMKIVAKSLNENIIGQVPVSQAINEIKKLWEKYFKEHNIESE